MLIPVKLETLLQGNSSKMALESHIVTPIKQPKRAAAATLFNKTGSSNGFGAYAAFIPQQKIGIVMLANTNFPNEARITATYHVMQQLLQRILRNRMSRGCRFKLRFEPDAID